MDGSNKNLATIASSLLSVFFIGIMLYVMLGVMDITSYENGTAALIFSAIDFVILFVMVGIGKPIAQRIGVGMYAPICTVTVAYTIISLGSSLSLCDEISTTYFVLIKVITLFVYCCIVIPMAVTGTNHKSEETRPEVRKHNL